jgi:hypothetical protein
MMASPRQQVVEELLKSGSHSKVNQEFLIEIPSESEDDQIIRDTSKVMSNSVMSTNEEKIVRANSADKQVQKEASPLKKGTSPMKFQKESVPQRDSISQVRGVLVVVMMVVSVVLVVLVVVLVVLVALVLVVLVVVMVVVIAHCVLDVQAGAVFRPPLAFRRWLTSPFSR